MMFFVSGIGLGIAISAFLALAYIGKDSFVNVSLVELLTAPLPILLAPPVLGLICATVSLKRRHQEQVAVAASFFAGALLGGVASLVIFLWTPFPHHGFFLHALTGVLIGGAIGSMTPSIAFRLGR